MIKGSIAALVTPFDVNNDVDYDKLRNLCDYHIENKTDGLCLLGTTAEAESLSDEEKVNIVRTVLEKTGGKIPIIVGLISNNQQRVIEMSKLFNNLDIDSFLVITPYYTKTNESGILKYFTYIADNVAKPIILYNVPKRTGMGLSFDIIRALAMHRNIKGIKEASGDMMLQQRLVSIISEEFYLYSGDDQTLLASLGIGASGFISVIANAFPLEMSTLYHEFDTNVKKSFDIYFKLLEIIDSIYLEVSPIGIKYLMYVIGLIDCKYRVPLDEPGRQTKRAIEERAYEYLSNLN